MTARLEVILPRDRIRHGSIELQTPATPVIAFPWETKAGPFSCYAKADNEAATDAGNPGRDPLHMFGDFPLGEYSCRLVVPGGSGPLSDKFKREYGPYGFIELTPKSGDALTAQKNGRYGLRVHSGAPGTAGQLRPTHGCLRLSDEDFLALRTAIADLTAALTIGEELVLTLVAEQDAVVLPLAS